MLVYSPQVGQQFSITLLYLWPQGVMVGQFIGSWTTPKLSLEHVNVVQLTIHVSPGYRRGSKVIIVRCELGLKIMVRLGLLCSNAILNLAK